MATAFILLTPASIGAYANPSRTIAAPYFGSVTASNTRTVSACGTAGFSHPANFNLLNGTGGFSNFASGKTCGKRWGGAPGYGDALGGIRVSVIIPAKRSTNSSTQIVIHWNLRAAYARSAVGGTCIPTAAKTSSCGVDAWTSVWASAWILDDTNGTVTRASNTWYGVQNGTGWLILCNYGYCIVSWPGPAWNGTFTASPSFFFNVTGMKLHHTYELDTQIYGEAFAGAFVQKATLSGGSASASLNLRSPGNGLNLTSITET